MLKVQENPVKLYLYVLTVNLLQELPKDFMQNHFLPPSYKFIGNLQLK
jgi:hypothetical protein